MEYKDVKTFVILDNGASVAIATKIIWEAWGKLAICCSRIKIQRKDGHLERPSGLLENIVLSSCDIEYIPIFTIVDFGSKPTYDVILGCPFMCQLKVIQDWGNNYIYLRVKTPKK